MWNHLHSAGGAMSPASPSGADIAVTPGNFGALARIGDEAARRLRPIVGEIVLAPELLPQRLGQKLRPAVPGEPDQEFAILDKPQSLAEPAHRERRFAPHRD